MYKDNRCPKCHEGIIYCHPEGDSMIREFCTNCDFTLVRKKLRRKQIFIPFFNRRKEHK